jgi:hypothetical protein
VEDNPLGESDLARLNESHFKHLFIILATVFFCVPIIDEMVNRPFPLFAQLIYLIVFGSVLLGAIGIAKSRRTLYAVVGLSALAVILHALHIWWQFQALLVWHHLIVILVLAFFTVSLVRYLFVCRTVTIHTIYSALCSYLLIALIWALAYGVVDIVQPGSFNMPSETYQEGELVATSMAGSFRSLYFSMVTITTLGYGDFFPISNSARGLATAEAFIGQMFIAITVARLVGIYTARALRVDD